MGDIPLTVNVPSGLVVTGAKSATPVPVNDIVLPPIPAFEALLSVSLPVTFTVVFQGTLAIVFSTIVVWCILVDAGAYT